MDVIATASYAAPEMDEMSVCGFVVSFVTVVYLLYRREIKTQWRMLGVFYAALALYGFVSGLWPLGIVLSTLAVIEFRGGQMNQDEYPAMRLMDRKIPPAFPARMPMPVSESRVSRLFGA
jgi:hypothetical protein